MRGKPITGSLVTGLALAHPTILTPTQHRLLIQGDSQVGIVMATRNLLQANCERLLTQYHSNIQAVLALQTTLIRDILPSVTDELELSPEAMEWAKEWLEDTST